MMRIHKGLLTDYHVSIIKIPLGRSSITIPMLPWGSNRQYPKNWTIHGWWSCCISLISLSKSSSFSGSSKLNKHFTATGVVNHSASATLPNFPLPMMTSETLQSVESSSQKFISREFRWQRRMNFRVAWLIWTDDSAFPVERLVQI